MKYRTPLLLIAVLYSVVYLLPLSGHPLFIPDETRYAEIPREMLQSGDWIVPRLNGLRYFEKPVMGYWLSAASLYIFGENSFAVRLPTALSTGLTALLIFSLCLSCCGRKSRLPLLASFVYLTTLGVKAIASTAVLDTPFTLFLTATLVLFFMASEKQPGSAQERTYLFATGLLAGCAFLTKGFLACALPVIVAVPYLLLQRRLKDLFRMAVLPVVGALLVSLPWSILVHLREPDYWNYFFWHEHVHRFFAEKAQHAEPFYYFILVLPAMFMPWIVLLPAAITGGWRVKNSTQGETRRLLIFCFCWFLFPFVFFSVSSGKLLTYILPCLPPLVILFTYFLNEWMKLDTNKIHFIQWGIWVLAGIMFVLFVSISVLHLIGPERYWIYHRPWVWLFLVGSIGVTLLLLCIGLQSKQDSMKVMLIGLSFSVLFFSIQFTIPTKTLERKAPGPFLGALSTNISADTLVISGGDIVRAVCWYLKRSDVYMIQNAGELQYGVSNQAPDEPSRLLTIGEAQQLLKRRKGEVIAIFDLEAYYNYWHTILPPPAHIQTSGIKGYLVLHY